ncbi:hypothetical protein FA95DRAFT_1676863 [Auriscalpium vulgare]|uniref:Uncharacterized protein n=1 Tax=Auriscalpium vulgare TaxID=40419 RepID=A0ACB8S1H8_9AGAM|nr:hypothetical protein FA95DRAFT_1676863 [Auriscalpium vulgare]
MSLTSALDPWDRPLQESGTLSARRAPATAVPDDWDVDDEPDEQDAQKIWEDANTKAPMPIVILAPSRSQAVVPPPSAFQTPIRILKRTPTPNAGTSSPSPSASPGPGTFAERSARYNAARERIFADGKGGGEEKGKPEGESQGIIRNPIGPGVEGADGAAESVGAGSSRGFGRRRKKGSGRGGVGERESVDASAPAARR